MTNTPHQYDVIIVGGGIAGMTLTCLLAKNNITVACIDQTDWETLAKADERTTAISYGSSLILEHAGIWSMMDGKTCPIKDIEILDSGSPALLNFLHSDINEDAFGWVVDNRDLRLTLKNQIDALQTAALISPAKVTQFSLDQNSACVHLQDNETLSAPLIIGADGRTSKMRDFLDIPTNQHSYNQRAIVCMISHERPHNNIAVEHFRPQGPLAILPMHSDEHGNHRSSIVITEHGKQHTSLMEMSEQDFEYRLAALFPKRYGNITIAGNRAAYPLGLIHASEYIGPRMALMADAAHGIHPIAGQGLNLGLRDAKTLSALIGEAHKSGEDIGNSDLLQTYQRQRRPDNVTMIALTETLNHVFSNALPPVAIARKIALKTIAKCPPLKNFFIRKTMGI